MTPKEVSEAVGTKKVYNLWGGFISGKLDAQFYPLEPLPKDTPVAIFATRKIAKKFYEDVRKVRVIEI